MASLGGDPEGWQAEQYVDWWARFWDFLFIVCLPIGVPIIIALGIAGVI